MLFPSRSTGRRDRTIRVVCGGVIACGRAHRNTADNSSDGPFGRQREMEPRASESDRKHTTLVGKLDTRNTNTELGGKPPSPVGRESKESESETDSTYMKIRRLCTGHDPNCGSGQKVLSSKSHGSGQVGSGGVQHGRDGSGLII